eukprot:10635854-Lingulodinium_polyedra.AAC.1
MHSCSSSSSNSSPAVEQPGAQLHHWIVNTAASHSVQQLQSSAQQLPHEQHIDNAVLWRKHNICIVIHWQKILHQHCHELQLHGQQWHSKSWMSAADVPCMPMHILIADAHGITMDLMKPDLSWLKSSSWYERLALWCIQAVACELDVAFC